ncbi:MAG: DUF4837 family protein [Candidatus Krumholzibacteria bacterium]|nr:DUF4837 family protein [Candidatus Krumholzibacteria bacterium]
MRRTRIVAAAAALAMILSCGRHAVFVPPGSYSEVVIVTETGLQGGLGDEIISVLQHPLDFYSKMEYQFKWRLVAAADYEQEPPSKNMVIFGVVREGGIGSIIEQIIGTDNVRKVIEGKQHIIARVDYPVRGQLTVVVTASTAQQLREVARGNGGKIRDVIEQANRERLRENLLLSEDAGTAADLKAKYGFAIRIPGEYRLNRDWGHLPGVEIFRDYPHRGITVSWRGWSGRALSTADSAALYDLRAQIMWEIHDKEVMRPELVSWSMSTLGEYDAVRMDGYWESSEEMYGGPFICFFIHDRVRARVWLVDCLVYAPGFDKNPLLREVWSIAETFRID